MATDADGLPVYPLPAPDTRAAAGELLDTLAEQSREMQSFANSVLRQLGAETEHQGANLRRVTDRITRLLNGQRRQQARDLGAVVGQVQSTVGTIAGEGATALRDVQTAALLAGAQRIAGAGQPVDPGSTVGLAPPPSPPSPAQTQQAGAMEGAAIEWPIAEVPANGSGVAVTVQPAAPLPTPEPSFVPGWYCLEAPAEYGPDWLPLERRALLLSAGSWDVRRTAGWRLLSGPYPDWETASAACAPPVPAPPSPAPEEPVPEPEAAPGKCCPVNITVQPAPVNVTCPAPQVFVTVPPGPGMSGGALPQPQPPSPPWPPLPGPEPEPTPPAPWPTEPPGVAAPPLFVPDTPPIDWELQALLALLRGVLSFVRA